MSTLSRRVVKLSCLLLVTLLLVAILIAGCTKPSPSPSQGPAAKEPEPVHIKAVNFLRTDHPLASAIPIFIDKVKEKSSGEVVIDYLGGPEVIPALEQVEALRKGKMIDMVFSVSAYYQAVVPEAIALHLSRILPWEERQSGFYDLMVEYHKKANLMYLGRWLYSPFYLWVNKPVKSPEDLRGMRMRTQALYDRFMKKLGIIPVSVPSTETYTALERGMVEGFGWPILGPRKDGWTEKVKYIIGHSFYDMQNATILMNLEKYNSLSPEQQKALRDAAVEFEPLMVEHYKKLIDNELKVLKENEKVTVIEFSPEDAKRYVDTAYEAEWEALAQELPTDVVKKLKETSQKK